MTTFPPNGNMNGYMQFMDTNKMNYFGLYIDQITQPHQLSTNSSQTRLVKIVYPRSYMPGDITVNGTCLSQEEYQELALFIRFNHRTLISTPSNMSFTNPTGPGAQRLISLFIPSENIAVQGFIPSFDLTKRGTYFDPAPQYQFAMTVVFDSQKQEIIASRSVTKYFDPTVQSYDSVTGEYVPPSGTLDSNGAPAPGTWVLPTTDSTNFGSASGDNHP